MSLSGGATSNYGTNEKIQERAAGNSVRLTAGIIIADVVGAGILSMGVAVSKLGLVLGAAGIVVLLAMNVHISILMWRVHVDFEAVSTYRELVMEAFSKAPQAQRSFMRLATTFCQYTFIFCMLGLYTLSAGKGLGVLFYDVHFCLPTWCFIACLFLLPFHLTTQKLGHWQSLIFLNVATIAGTTGIPLIFVWATGVEASRPTGSVVHLVAELSAANTFGALSTFTFAFTSQFMLAEIISEMEDRKEFPKAYIAMAAPFQAIAFLAVGLIGYYYLGNAISGMIGDNIPFGPTSQVAAICLLVHMLITYMIKGIVLCRAILQRVDSDILDSEASWPTYQSIVLGTVLCSWGLAQIVPFFSDAVELLGASLTPVACYIIPILMYLRWDRDFKDFAYTSKFEVGIIILELVFACSVMVAGTYYSCNAIAEKWTTYGGPFECHCEGMWKTCECSSGHVGMEQCLALNSIVSLPIKGPV